MKLILGCCENRFHFRNEKMCNYWFIKCEKSARDEGPKPILFNNVSASVVECVDET